MPLRRTAVVFTLLWFPLAFWQCARTARVCFDGSGWSVALWTLQFAMLVIPLLTLRRLARPAANEAPDLEGASATLILLAYVPLTLALRLGESCGSPQ
jgi:hypothetical protein